MFIPSMILSAVLCLQPVPPALPGVPIPIEIDPCTQQLLVETEASIRMRDLCLEVGQPAIDCETAHNKRLIAILERFDRCRVFVRIVWWLTSKW